MIEMIFYIKRNKKAMRDLQAIATKKWGELYFLNKDFHSSVIAIMMEKHNADIDHYLYQFFSINQN